MSRANGYGSYRSSDNNSYPEDRRPNSETLVDLHVYLVPPDLWRDRYNNLLNKDVTEAVSAGIIRVHPEQKLVVLRDEIDNQIGTDEIPKDYVFLKGVGRSITKLRHKQEYQLKVKHFLEPQSYAPGEIFLLETQDIDGSHSSVRAESPEYNPENDNISRRSVGGKRSYNPSPRYNQYSPVPKNSQKDLSQRHRHSPAHTSLRPDYIDEHNSSSSHRLDQNGKGGRYEEVRDDPSPSRYKSRPRDGDSRHIYDQKQNGSDRPLSASWGSSQGHIRRKSPPRSHHPPDEISAPPLSATPPPLTEKLSHRKAPPRRETYTNHTNEDSGIEGLTPEDHYRENNYDDVLDRRKKEEEEKRRSEQELQQRLKAEAEDEERQRRRLEDQDRLEWERRQKEEAEKRQREEEERRKREEEERRKEEEERRLREEEREKLSQDKLSASDEKYITPRGRSGRSEIYEKSKMSDSKDLVASSSTTILNGRQEILASPSITKISGRKEKTGVPNVTVIVNVNKSDEQEPNDTSSQDLTGFISRDGSGDVTEHSLDNQKNMGEKRVKKYLEEQHKRSEDNVNGTREQEKPEANYEHSTVSQMKEQAKKPKEVSWSDVVKENDRGKSLITTDGEESMVEGKKYDNYRRAEQQALKDRKEKSYSEFSNAETAETVENVNNSSKTKSVTSDLNKQEHERSAPESAKDGHGDRSSQKGIPKISVEQETSDQEQGSYARSSGSIQRSQRTYREPFSTYKDHQSMSGYTSDVSDSYQEDKWNRLRKPELNRFPSPPPLNMLPPPAKGDNSSRHLDKADKEQLMRELEQAREARKQMEKNREDLVKKAKMLQNKMQNRRNHARDLWKKRYFEEKKRTSPLEEQCNRLRHELEIIHRRLMNTLEGPTNQKVTRVGDMKPSIQSNYKIQATRLLHEIDDIKRRLENAKMKLTAEMKLRNQAETELRAMRAELTQKKINLTLTRNQQLAGLGTVSVSDSYIPHHAITPRS